MVQSLTVGVIAQKAQLVSLELLLRIDYPP